MPKNEPLLCHRCDSTAMFECPHGHPHCMNHFNPFLTNPCECTSAPKRKVVLQRR